MHDRIRVPLCLAIKSTDAHPLKITRMEFIYDDSLKVRSTASPRILPGHFVYEREIRYLDSQSSGYLLVAPVDTVVVPFKFRMIMGISLAANGVPILSRALVPVATRDLAFEMRVLCDGRVPRSIQVRCHTGRTSNYISYEDGFQGRPLTSFYRALLPANLSRLPSQGEWEFIAPHSGARIEYRRVLAGGNTLQLFIINGTMRKVLVDKGTDKTVDAMLIDQDGNGVVDSMLVPTSKHLMVDWIPALFEGDSVNVYTDIAGHEN
jgi:hypothetical protein